MKAFRKNWLRRGLSLLLILVMCMGMITTSAFAAENETAVNEAVETTAESTEESTAAENETAETTAESAEESTAAENETAESAEESMAAENETAETTAESAEESTTAENETAETTAESTEESTAAENETAENAEESTAVETLISDEISLYSVDGTEDDAVGKCPTPEIYLQPGMVSVEGYFLQTISVAVDLAKYNGTSWTKGYTCYYTTDGTEPSSTNGKKVLSALKTSITSSTMNGAVDGVLTYKIIATKEGMADSDVATIQLKVLPDGVVPFTDEALKLAVCKALGKEESIDTVITEEDMKGLTTLVAENSGIKHLGGVRICHKFGSLRSQRK